MLTMKDRSFYHEIESLWHSLDQTATESKQSHQATIELSRLYRAWDAEHQKLAREVFGEWLHSSNARKRFDALSIIDEFLISEAASGLYDLREKLRTDSSPEALFEIHRITGILEKFEQ